MGPYSWALGVSAGRVAAAAGALALLVARGAFADAVAQGGSAPAPALPPNAPAAAAPAMPSADDATFQARALFNEGIEQAGRGDWSVALATFERSAALHPHAVTTYNIGYCERALGRYTQARKMLGRALAESAAHGGGELPDDLTASAKTYLTELEQHIARAVVSVSPEGASVLVDGRPLEGAVSDGSRAVFWAGTRELGPAEPAPASTFELEIDPGAHVFVASKAGYSDDASTRTFQQGSEVSLVLQLSPLAPAAPASIAPASAAQAESGVPSPNRLPLYLALGVGAVGLVTGTTAGIVALRLRMDSQTPEAHTVADVSTVAFVLGGAGTATAAVLWWTSRRAAAQPHPQPAASRPARVPSGGALRDVQVMPWVTPAGGGIAGTF